MCVPGACVCVCVFTAVCVHLDGLIAELKFRVWVTIVGRMSRHLHFHYFALEFQHYSVSPILYVDYKYLYLL